jgi:crotonobetainyl-CoA:carnitine CoA-transferase CaiB-like acyl-CoA transferase
MTDLRQADRRLITCDISGYGASGPFAQMKAYDFLVQAEVGLAQITGAPEEPGRVGVSICDIAAGMTAHAAILQALVALSLMNNLRMVRKLRVIRNLCLL